MNKHLLFYKEHYETTDNNAPPLLCNSSLFPKNCSSSILMNQYFGVHLSKSRVLLLIVGLIINIILEIYKK